MTKELLEKIPAEKCWALTAKILTTFAVLRGEKRVATEMGTGEGIISPVLGVEKWYEIDNRAWGEEAGRNFSLWIKETFNIPVKDAIGAAKLFTVFGVLFCGPEWEDEVVEKTPERVVLRVTKCSWWNRYTEHEVDYDVVTCYPIHETSIESGFKAVNPKLTSKLTRQCHGETPTAILSSSLRKSKLLFLY